MRRKREDQLGGTQSESAFALLWWWIMRTVVQGPRWSKFDFSFFKKKEQEKENIFWPNKKVKLSYINIDCEIRIN